MENKIVKAFSRKGTKCYFREVFKSKGAGLTHFLRQQLPPATTELLWLAILMSLLRSHQLEQGQAPRGCCQLKSRVADRVLVLPLGVRPEPLRWESRVEDIGPPETSRPQIIRIGKSAPRDLRLNTKTQLHSTTSKFQCWTLHAKQLAR